MNIWLLTITSTDTECYADEPVVQSTVWTTRGSAVAGLLGELRTITSDEDADTVRDVHAQVDRQGWAEFDYGHFVYYVSLAQQPVQGPEPLRRGDRVRLDRDIDKAVQSNRTPAGVLPAGMPEFRIDGPLLATVLNTANGAVALEWDADADGGPYEDECEEDMLMKIDASDARLIDVAAQVDKIVPQASFAAQAVRTLWGDISDMVEDYGDDVPVEAIREGMLETLVDDMVCELAPHGLTVTTHWAGDYYLTAV